MRYHWGADITVAVRDAITTLEGQAEYSLRSRTHEFYRHKIEELFFGCVMLYGVKIKNSC